MIKFPFNSQVSISTPFPRKELPALFYWTEKARLSIADDSVPADVTEFVDWQKQREQDSNLVTFAVKRNGSVGGYVEAILPDDGMPAGSYADELLFIAECRAVFRREMFDPLYSKTAVNLCLRELFADAHGIETVFFRLFERNRAMRSLLFMLGFGSLGQVSPRTQNGEEKATQLFGVSRREWTLRNEAFIQAVAEFEAKSAEPLEAIAV